MFSFFTNPKIAHPLLQTKDPKHQKIVENGFFLKGTGNVGVLLIHGWTCTPYEMYWLGKYLNKKGMGTYGVKLTGHGNSPTELANTKYKDWIQDITKAYEILKENYEHIHVVGNSLGGNFAATLAARKQDVRSLVMVGSPYKVRKGYIARFLSVFWPISRRFIEKKYPKYPAIPNDVISHFLTYKTYPTKNIKEVVKTIARFRILPPKIQQPTLIIESTADHVVTKNNMRIIYKKLKKAKRKEQMYIPDAYHNLLYNPKHIHIFKKIADFISSN